MKQALDWMHRCLHMYVGQGGITSPFGVSFMHRMHRALQRTRFKTWYKNDHRGRGLTPLHGFHHVVVTAYKS